MNIKKETGEILEFLKSKGVSRRQIEEDLAYKSMYIDQAYSRGGSEELLIRLKLYKQYILFKTRSGTQEGPIDLSHLVPGPEASLEQLLVRQRALRLAAEEIDDRIDKLLSSGKGNSAGGKQENHTHKDNLTNKDRFGKPR